MRIKDEQQIEKKKEEILSHAKNILLEEGFDQLSIRKIAARMKQTPGILYHYFENKEMILTRIVEDGYQLILQSIQKNRNVKDLQERLLATLTSYMECMCEQKELFLLLMSSKDPNIRMRVDVLKEDAIERQSIRFLCSELETGVKNGVFEIEDCYRKTQWVWCATYGVISRIIQEQITDEQKNLLIKEHVTSILKSLER
ncbi:TetR/AcrR family transcriptional regulator [Amedibacillus sp. YH-ame6]